MPVKIKVYPANVHDSIPLVPLVDELRCEKPELQIGNLNADNGYQSPKNAEDHAIRGINNSIARRQSSAVKVPKKRRNQRKCIEGIIGIGQQCLGLEQTRVRGLENVHKDTLLKGISMLFVSVVAAETGVEGAYLRPTFFFG
ncbi:MAG: transposase [Candidatus Sigynarchaeota archaeon]